MVIHKRWMLWDWLWQWFISRYCCYLATALQHLSNVIIFPPAGEIINASMNESWIPKLAETITQVQFLSGNQSWFSCISNGFYVSLCVVHSQFCVSAPVVLGEGRPGRSQGGAEMSWRQQQARLAGVWTLPDTVPLHTHTHPKPHTACISIQRELLFRRVLIRRLHLPCLSCSCS